MADYGIPQISTGDILRANIAKGTTLAKLAKALMDQGTLVSDDLVNQMVADRLAQPDTRRGYILDGFPRTLNQATGSMRNLPSDSLGPSGRRDQHRRRLRAAPPSHHRPAHLPAGRIYNIYSNPPAVPGICDVDGSTLVQRPDDSEAVFTERMKTFQSQTAPVIEHYRNQGRFQEVDGDHPVEQVTAAIESALKRLRATTSH